MLENRRFKLNKRYWILLSITLLALLIRMINIDKHFGLWNDEMLTFLIASKSFPGGILDCLFKNDFHMPLYYFYLHFWMLIFGASDVALRLSSAFWGVLTVPAFFYLGKTYKSELFGYFLSIIAGLSPILIYYSQEFRFYSMLVFFAAISIIFFLRLIDNFKKCDFIVLCLTNLVILYIYTMGIVFVAVEGLLLLLNYFICSKNVFKVALKYTIVFYLFTIPYFLMLLFYITSSDNAFSNAFGWSISTFWSILFLLQDWFSPIIIGIGIQDPRMLYGELNNMQTIFWLLPAFCFTLCLILSLMNLNKRKIYLLLMAAAFFLTEAYLCQQGKFLIVTRYTVVILPILFLIGLDGLFWLKLRYRYLCLSMILIPFVFNVIYAHDMPSFSERLNGLNRPAEALRELGIKNSDYILYSLNSAMLEKYFKSSHYIDFDVLGVMWLDKTNTQSRKVFSKSFIEETNQINASKNLIPYFLDSKPTILMQQFMDSQVAEIPRGSKLVLIFPFTDFDDYEKIQRETLFYVNKNFNTHYLHTVVDTIFYRKLHRDLYTSVSKNVRLKKIQEMDFDNRWKFFVYIKQ